MIESWQDSVLSVSWEDGILSVGGMGDCQLAGSVVVIGNLLMVVTVLLGGGERSECHRDWWGVCRGLSNADWEMEGSLLSRLPGSIQGSLGL